MSILKRKTKKTEETSADAQVVAAPAEVKKTTRKKAAPKAEAKAEAKVATKTISRFAAETIIAPLVTEKAARLSGANVMVFEVAPKATRVAVKQAIKELYNVMPTKVNIMNVRGGSVRFGRFTGIRKDSKKAMVTLPAGTHIDVFAS